MSEGAGAVFGRQTGACRSPGGQPLTQPTNEPSYRPSANTVSCSVRPGIEREVVERRSLSLVVVVVVAVDGGMETTRLCYVGVAVEFARRSRLGHCVKK